MSHLVYGGLFLPVVDQNAKTVLFVGHNAFLRWSALQEIAYKDETDNGRIKYWSEDHVSEDFEMSLKLQSKGYIVRLVTYHNDQFQEGVSLTVYDELTRWQKYAYGCSELVFRPVRQWHTGKIFTPLFSRFLQSDKQRFPSSQLLHTLEPTTPSPHRSFSRC
ncbi:glycosyl transferase family group 2-domain-containing protein [Lipomyces starkeyi]